MPQISPDTSAEPLLKQLRELHSTSIAALDNMETRGLTSVPIANTREIVNAYMAVALRFARLYAASMRDAEQRGNAFSTGHLGAYFAAALATGVALGAAITMGLVLLVG